MSGRRVIGLCGAALAALALSACGSKPVVGVVLPVSGSAAGYGESIESGMRLAINDARTANQLPPKFEVAWADSASDPQTSIKEIKRLVKERGAKIIIGAATSAEAEAIVKVLDDIDVVCLSPSASAPGLSQKSRLFFRIYPSDELEGQTAAKFMIDRLGATKTVLFVGRGEYVEGIEPEFRERYEDSLGGEITATVDLGADGWQAQVPAVLKANKPAAVYIIGYSDDILAAIRRLKEVGYKGRIVTTSAFYTSAGLKEAGADAEGVFFPLPPFDRTSETEPVVSFVHRYMDTYERAPDVFAAHGYDAMKIAIQVLNLAHPLDTTEVYKALHFG